MSSYFRKHVFFCVNQRDDGSVCCNSCNATEMHAYTKERIKALKQDGAGKIRINRAGCLDRCDEGPALVVYPEGTWYRYVDASDLDEIIEEDLLNNRPVERLKI